MLVYESIIQPLQKTAIEYSHGYKAARPKGAAHTENPSSIAAITSAGNNTIEAACVMENVPIIASSELSSRETLSDGDKTSVVDLDIISNRKSRRRRSYTSLLMTRSKVLELHIYALATLLLVNLFPNHCDSTAIRRT